MIDWHLQHGFLSSLRNIEGNTGARGLSAPWACVTESDEGQNTQALREHLVSQLPEHYSEARDASGKLHGA